MPLEKVIYQHRGIDHEDERRALGTAFNGDFNGFTAKQVKTYRVHQDSQLGGNGHYHHYRELFYVIMGEIEVSLKDTETGERARYSLRNTDSLMIPALVAHKFFAKKGTIFVGCSEEPYVSPELNDNKHEF